MRKATKLIGIFTIAALCLSTTPVEAQRALIQRAIRGVQNRTAPKQTTETEQTEEAVPATTPERTARPAQDSRAAALSRLMPGATAASPDEINSFEKLKMYAFMAMNNEEINKELREGKTHGFSTRFAETMQPGAEKAVAAAEKMVKLAKNDDERNVAYMIMQFALIAMEKCEKIPVFHQLMKEEGVDVDALKIDAKDLAVLRKWQALFEQKTAHVETEAEKRGEALIEALENEGTSMNIVNQWKYGLFVKKCLFTEDADFNREEFEKRKEEAKEFINIGLENEHAKPLQHILKMTGTKSARKADPDLFDKTLEELTAFVMSDDCEIGEGKKAALVEELRCAPGGPFRSSVGESLNLYGRTLDGKPFNARALRGKYVLVVFVSSKDRACQKEYPGLIKLYEKYAGKGFETVFVFVAADQVADIKNTVARNKLPGIHLSEALGAKNGDTPFFLVFGKEARPILLLVDKDDKIIATPATGSELPALLEKHLGE